MDASATEIERPILIGEAPSKSGDRYYMVPLSGAVAETLCKLAGIPPQEGGTRYGQWTWALYEHFECRNLIRRYPGAQGRGASFPMDVARERAFNLLPKLQGRVVVLLGSRLDGLLTCNADPGFSYTWVSDLAVWKCGDDRVAHQIKVACQAVAIPHPSGLNRMLNDPAERERCGATLREAMQRADAAARRPTRA